MASAEEEEVAQEYRSNALQIAKSKPLLTAPRQWLGAIYHVENDGAEEGE